MTYDRTTTVKPPTMNKDGNCLGRGRGGDSILYRHLKPGLLLLVFVQNFV